VATWKGPITYVKLGHNPFAAAARLPRVPVLSLLAPPREGDPRTLGVLPTKQTLTEKRQQDVQAKHSWWSNFRIALPNLL